MTPPLTFCAIEMVIAQPDCRFDCIYQCLVDLREVGILALGPCRTSPIRKLAKVDQWNVSVESDQANRPLGLNFHHSASTRELGCISSPLSRCWCQVSVGILQSPRLVDLKGHL